ncbi:sigma-54-dependent transcriptional regulator YgeV [Klebsiella michiganensis]|uniref:Sigma-54-dependent transcriptional regulator YgeV n=1 Tax=Klebsiella michiganensis TaxID=1134687 RepID=A0A7H4PKR7_9ENTR|nr:sigma-54-dependent transcriptional regulator YgeV [Klebsiella michiganensis]
MKFFPPLSISAGQARVATVNNAIIIFTLRQYDKNRCKFIIMIRNCDSSCIFKIRWGNWPYLYQRGWLKGVVSFPQINKAASLDAEQVSNNRRPIDMIPSKAPSILMQIQPTIQKFARMLSSVLQLEVEIVDNELYRVAGTGAYSKQIGYKLNSNSRPSALHY